MLLKVVAVVVVVVLMKMAIMLHPLRQRRGRRHGRIASAVVALLDVNVLVALLVPEHQHDPASATLK